jgi:hypothetical protein
VAGRALGTRAAAAVAHHDGVARPDPCHAVADLLDDAGALVPEHDRIALLVPRDLRPDALHAQVGVADPAGDEPHQDLVRPRLVELDVLEGEGASRGVRDGGFDDDGHIYRGRR